MMTNVRTEGVILQRLTYKEADQILIVLTANGLIKLAFKGALSKKRGSGSLTVPLQLAEFVYREHAGDLSSCREISVLHPYLRLRERLESLESAGEMTRAVLSLLQPDAPAPLLYKLFLCYLETMPSATNPSLLAGSFKMKFLRHEGILSLEPKCSICQASLQEISIIGGECYCAEHAPSDAIIFNQHETTLLVECTYGKSLKSMAQLSGTPFFLKKIDRLFTISCSPT